MQILEGEDPESRWSPCVRRSWAHPCCLLTSSQLSGLNPHTRISSPQALWACWTPNSRFNLPSSFTFINRHLFFFLSVNPSQRQSLWFIAFFFLRTTLLDFREGFSLVLFLCIIFPSLDRFHHAHMACLQRALSIRCSPANTPVCADSLLTVWDYSIISSDML